MTARPRVGRDDLPRGAARGHPRGAAARRPGLPDGRGRRRVRRLLRRQPRPARGVRARADPRHPAVGVGVRRRRHRRRARRHATDRRDHDGQLQPARARPDHEQRGLAAAHVRRPVQRAARDPDDHRRPAGSWPRSTRTAWRAGTPTSPASGSLAPATLEDARGMLLDRPAGPRPGADLRARLALQPGRASCRPTRGRSTSTTRRVRRDRRRRHARSPTAAPWARPLEAAERAGGATASRPRSSTCARCGRSTTRRFVGSVRRTHRAVVVDEGWRSGSLSAEISAPDHGAGVLRPRRPGRAGLHRRGADALRQAPGGGRAAPGPRRSSARAAAGPG